MENNKEKIKALVNESLDRATEAMKAKIDRVLNSGCVDTDSWDINSNPMILPKQIVIALLENEAEEYKGVGTRFEKEVKKGSNNIKLFL
jgi:diphthamide synthase subunit DPH2